MSCNDEKICLDLVNINIISQYVIIQKKTHKKYTKNIWEIDTTWKNEVF